MALRCRLLGHTYGDPETVHDREESGTEVVETVREVEVCTRCGTERVVAENTEVKTTADPEPETQPAEPDHKPIDTNVDPDLDDAEILSDEPVSDRKHGEWPTYEKEETEPEPEPEADDDPSPWPDHDVEVERGDVELADPTPWPDHEDLEPEQPPADVNPTPWPEIEGDDEGFDARPDEEADVEVEFGGSLTPQRATGSGSDDDVIEPSSDIGSDGFARVQEAPDPAAPDPNAGTAAEYFCPLCDFVERSTESSVRVGDICPSCQEGFLAERQS